MTFRQRACESFGNLKNGGTQSKFFAAKVRLYCVIVVFCDVIWIKNSRENRPVLRSLDMNELYAFLGLLMYTAVFKSNHEGCEYLLAIDWTERNIFRSVMSQKRFMFLLLCLRFDTGAENKMIS